MKLKNWLIHCWTKTLLGTTLMLLTNWVKLCDMSLRYICVVLCVVFDTFYKTFYFRTVIRFPKHLKLEQFPKSKKLLGFWTISWQLYPSKISFRYKILVTNAIKMIVDTLLIRVILASVCCSMRNMKSITIQELLLWIK